VDGVTEQLRGRILQGDIQPGETLPTEQVLCDTLGVSRSAVREALNRLAAARLVSIRHSGSKVVLDYRRAAGLELLPSLLLEPNGEINVAAVRSVLEMRSAIAPDVARLAAERAAVDAVGRLHQVVRQMHDAEGDLVILQTLAGEFWSHLVDASENVAYRLAYNSLRGSYDACRQLFTQVLAAETGDVDLYAAIAGAVERRDPITAESLARALVQRGERAIVAALLQLTPS
jgi:GntR family transcriptional repressor for pyruvate dehydrogenase complex